MRSQVGAYKCKRWRIAVYAWTYRSMQYADSVLGNNLMDMTAMITGSSGGLIGASYFRQLHKMKVDGELAEVQDADHLRAVSEDILNP